MMYHLKNVLFVSQKQVGKTDRTVFRRQKILELTPMICMNGVIESNNYKFPVSGADILGLNCQYDYKTCIKTIKMMKEGLEKAGIKDKYLMVQAVCYHCPEVENLKNGYHELPEFPFGK